MRKRMSVVCILVFAVFTVVAQEAEKPCEKEVQKMQVKEIQPYTYIAVEMKGSFSQHEQAFGVLYGSAGQQGIALMDAPMGIYYNNPQQVPEDSLIWELGVAVTGVDSVAAPLVLKQWPYTTLVTTVYEGAFNEELNKMYYSVYKWITENGYQAAGPMVEKYLSMPKPDENGVMSGQVEIIAPVQKAE